MDGSLEAIVRQAIDRSRQHIRDIQGSMWTVNDEVADRFFSAFYDMLDGSGRLECIGAAVALHGAVKRLRKEIPLERLIVFIHIGV